jgi:hypothetical protein
MLRPERRPTKYIASLLRSKQQVRKVGIPARKLLHSYEITLKPRLLCGPRSKPIEWKFFAYPHFRRPV